MPPRTVAAMRLLRLVYAFCALTCLCLVLEMLAGFAQEFFARDVEAAILFLTPNKITASTHFIRYKVRGGTFDPPTQGDTNSSKSAISGKRRRRMRTVRKSATYTVAVHFSQCVPYSWLQSILHTANTESVDGTTPSTVSHTARHR